MRRNSENTNALHLDLWQVCTVFLHTYLEMNLRYKRIEYRLLIEVKSNS